MSRAMIKVLGASELVSVDVNIVTNTITIGDSVLSANEIQFDNPITGTVFGTLLTTREHLKDLAIL